MPTAMARPKPTEASTFRQPEALEPGGQSASYNSSSPSIRRPPVGQSCISQGRANCAAVRPCAPGANRHHHAVSRPASQEDAWALACCFSDRMLNVQTSSLLPRLWQWTTSHSTGYPRRFF